MNSPSIDSSNPSTSLSQSSTPKFDAANREPYTPEGQSQSQGKASKIGLATINGLATIKRDKQFLPLSEEACSTLTVKLEDVVVADNAGDAGDAARTADAANELNTSLIDASVLASENDQG